MTDESENYLETNDGDSKAFNIIDFYKEMFDGCINSYINDVPRKISDDTPMEAISLAISIEENIASIHKSLSEIYKIIYDRKELFEKYNSPSIARLKKDKFFVGMISPVLPRTYGYHMLSGGLPDGVKPEGIEKNLKEALGNRFSESHILNDSKIKRILFVDINYYLFALKVFVEDGWGIDIVVSEEPQDENDRYIQKSVKMEVWRRDQGKCSECKSNKKLEYDHIITVSKGGSNTARNIQLLCEECNRRKSANIDG